MGTLASGEIAVRDERGIQLFGRNLEFIMFLAEEVIDRCYGLAEDDDGKIITINCNTVVGGIVKLTMPGNTDVFFIDRGSNRVVKRVEMVDLIGQAVLELQSLQADMSACRSLSSTKMGQSRKCSAAEATKVESSETRLGWCWT